MSTDLSPAMMKQNFGEATLHMLQPKALFSFASQSLGFVTQSLGYRDPAAYANANEDDPFGLDIRQKDEESGLDIYSLSEVSQHETFDDCWIVVFDKVSCVANGCCSAARPLAIGIWYLEEIVYLHSAAEIMKLSLVKFILVSQAIISS